MSNLTVSSAVDEFMQSSDQAAMQAAIGVGPSKYTAFLASYGNDSSGVVGDPSHPFASPAAAYAALQAVSGYMEGTTDLYFQILPGNSNVDWGTLALTGTYGAVPGYGALYFGGFSGDSSPIPITAPAGSQVEIYGNGRNLVCLSVSVPQGSVGACGVTLNMVNVGSNVNATGTDEYGNGLPGGNAGNILLDDCNLNGASGVGGEGSDGANISGLIAILNIDLSNWDGQGTYIYFSGPGGTDTYYYSGYLYYMGGAGISTNVGESDLIEALSSGSGYSYSTDSVSNIDSQITFADGTNAQATNGGNGGSGMAFSARRSLIAGGVTIQSGAGGIGYNGGSSGTQVSPGAIAYFCEISNSGALTSQDPAPIAATERFCVDGGSSIDSQN